jgi:hypothetical protein
MAGRRVVSDKMMTIRLPQETRQGIERISRERGGSMSSHLINAADRYIRQRQHPHIGALADAIGALAEEIEHRTGKSITDDPETSVIFQLGISDLLARYAAKPGSPSNVNKQIATFAAGVAIGATDRMWGEFQRWGESHKVFIKSAVLGRKGKVTS